MSAYYYYYYKYMYCTCTCTVATLLPYTQFSILWVCETWKRFTMSSSRKFVDAAIADNKVVVFSKTYCPYCKMAKSALNETGAKYLTIELEGRDDGDAIQDYMLELTKGRTVPRVFIGGKFVGGGSEVKQLQSQGKLKPMLQDVGAL